jgi:chemotaxis protein histidine kinase CheA
MDKLQWFKFTPSDWMMGKIQKCPADTRGMFMNLCCLYWNKECFLSAEDAEIEVDEDHFQTLLKKKIITIDGENIRISFLDDQMEEILETSEKRREAANKRWNKKKAKAMQTNASALQNDADKSKSREELEGDQNREDEKRKEKTLLCSISDESELDAIDHITFSFWRLFKANLNEVGITNTTTLDKATLEKWRNPIRLAMEKDGRTEEEFRELFRFLSKNQFWKKNIQSTSKLREQFERLLVGSRSKSNTTAHGEVPDDIREELEAIAKRRANNYGRD